MFRRSTPWLADNHTVIAVSLTSSAGPAAEEASSSSPSPSVSAAHWLLHQVAGDAVSWPIRFRH